MYCLPFSKISPFCFFGLRYPAKMECINNHMAVFLEKTDVSHLPNQSMVAISVMKLWPWKLGEDHQNLISYWSCPIYIGLQIW